MRTARTDFPADCLGTADGDIEYIAVRNFKSVRVRPLQK